VIAYALTSRHADEMRLTRFHIWSYHRRMTSASNRLPDPRGRAERAERILAVATDLLLRFGYRRVTIDDVARHADIGKGTVYLHWKTRDDLFRAVFEREVLAAVDELLEALRHEPGTWRPHRFACRYFLAITRRPLLRAFFLSDTELLGRLARPAASAREQRHRLLSQGYFELLAEHGVLRDDVSSADMAYAFLAVLEGFIHSQGAEGQDSDLQARSDLLALIVQRAFETGRRLSRATENVIAAQVVDLITELRDEDRADHSTD
jgi:AcrR family transcriptional regulator